MRRRDYFYIFYGLGYLNFSSVLFLELLRHSDGLEQKGVIYTFSLLLEKIDFQYCRMEIIVVLKWK